MSQRAATKYKQSRGVSADVLEPEEDKFEELPADALEPGEDNGWWFDEIFGTNSSSCISLSVLSNLS